MAQNNLVTADLGINLRDRDRQTVRKLALFCDMEERRFDDLLNAAFLQRFPERVTVVQEGDSADFLHVLIDGTVELFAALDKRESTMTVLSPVINFYPCGCAERRSLPNVCPNAHAISDSDDSISKCEVCDGGRRSIRAVNSK